MADQTDSAAVVYRFFDKAGNLLYIGHTANLATRLAGHKSQTSWYGLIANLAVRKYLNVTEARIAERAAIQTERPRFNVAFNAAVNKWGGPSHSDQIRAITHRDAA